MIIRDYRYFGKSDKAENEREKKAHQFNNPQTADFSKSMQEKVK